MKIIIYQNLVPKELTMKLLIVTLLTVYTSYELCCQEQNIVFKIKLFYYMTLKKIRSIIINLTR